MFWSNVTNAVLTFVVAIVTMIAIGSVDDAVAANSPIEDILLEVTGSVSATSTMIVGIFIVGILCVLGAMAMLSRLTWAWARDGGLPIYFAYVSEHQTRRQSQEALGAYKNSLQIDPKHRVPVRAIVLCITIVCCLSLLNFASATYVALNAVAALSALALYLSYFIAISSMLYSRYSKNSRLELGEWNWGRWGGTINIFAWFYTVYMAIWLPFPSTIPVTGANMNYCGPVMALVILLSVFSWFVWAKKNWTGPNTTIINHCCQRKIDPTNR